MSERGRVERILSEKYGECGGRVGRRCARGHYPNDRAAAKLIYLALRGVERKWMVPPAFWSDARHEFAIQFGDRFKVLAP